MRAASLAAMATIAITISAPAAPVAAQDTPLTAETARASLDAPTARALVEEYTNRDMRADPDGSIADTLAFYERVKATDDLSPEFLADAATLVGTAYFAGQKYEESVEWFDTAATIWATIPDRRDKQAEMLNNQGVLLRALKRLPAAESNLRRALSIRTELYGDSHEDVSSSMFSLGNVLFSQGRFEDALPLFRKVAGEQAKLTPDRPDLIVQRIEGLGAVLDDSGRDTEALGVLRQAEALARRELGTDHQAYGTVSHNLSLVLADIGLHEQAIEMSRQAVDIRRVTNGEDSPWTAASISTLATSLAATGESEAALALHEQALEIMQAKRNVVGSENIARIINEIAQIHLGSGAFDAFFDSSDMAIAEVDEGLGEIHPMRAATHLLRARALEQLGRTGEALPIAEKWVAILVDTLIPQNRQRIEGELLLARLRQAEGQDAATYWPMADDALARLRARLTDLSRSESERSGEAKANARSAILYMRMALAESDNPRAIEAAQLANISSLSLGIEGQIEAGDSVSDAAALYLEFREAAREETRVSQHRAFAVSSGIKELTEKLTTEVEALAAQKASLAEALQSEHGDWLNRFRPAPVSLDEIRAGLGEDELLILLVEGDTTSWALHVAAQGVIGTQEFETGEAARHVAALRGALESRAMGDFPTGAAHDLYRAIFGESDPQQSRITLYGGAKLASVPFAALTTRPHDGPLGNAPWLLRKASTRTMGNLQSLVGRGGSAQGSARSTFAGIGGVVPPGSANMESAALFRAGGPSVTAIEQLAFLPEAEDELRLIAEALRAIEPLFLVGEAATEAEFKRTDLSTRSIIAFATHGLIAGEIEGLWEPSLLLGGAGEGGEDGLLGASEIARLSLDADWVILSACNSASGSSQIAPPFSGLATAFSQAGARALLVSHWPLRDDAAARLSVDTVAGTAAGMSRDGALRKAQMALIESDVPDAAHPAIWAPLALVE